MPKTGKYRATIVIRGGRNKSSSPVAGSNKKTPEQKYQEKWDNSLKKGLMGLVSYSTISSTASNLISYEISQVELRTGAHEKEQKMQAVFSFGKRAVNSAAALVAGAVTGNLPLVAIGLVSSLVNSAISIGQKANTINTQQQLENISIQMQNERAGVQGRRGSVQ